MLNRKNTPSIVLSCVKQLSVDLTRDVTAWSLGLLIRWRLQILLAISDLHQRWMSPWSHFLTVFVCQTGLNHKLRPCRRAFTASQVHHICIYRCILIFMYAYLHIWIHIYIKTAYMHVRMMMYVYVVTYIYIIHTYITVQPRAGRLQRTALFYVLRARSLRALDGRFARTWAQTRWGWPTGDAMVLGRKTHLPSGYD